MQESEKMMKMFEVDKDGDVQKPYFWLGEDAEKDLDYAAVRDFIKKAEIKKSDDKSTK